MEIRELVDKTGLNPLTPLEDRNVTGVFISDMMSDVMTHARAGDLWITVQTHKNIVSSVNLVDIAAVVITHGKTVLEDTIELARKFQVIILSTESSTFELAAKLVRIGLAPV